MMKAPKFWKRGSRMHIPRLLSPFAFFYHGITILKGFCSNPKSINVPVICVGNIVVGGAGKTPTAIAISKLLSEKGENPYFLCRGYGGNLKGPIRVDTTIHNSKSVGDEALLLALRAPTWVSRNRLAGAIAASRDGASIIIMDDGHQNQTIKKDLSLIVIDNEFGFGNYKLLPAGPLRETLKGGISRADAAVFIGSEEFHDQNMLSDKNLPLIRAEFVPDLAAHKLRDKAVVAFAGIGWPEKFFNTLRSLECHLLNTYSFPDHHQYTPNEIMNLVEKAAELNADLVTTEKDWMRLDIDSRSMVKVVSGEIKWQQTKELESILTPVLELGRK